MRLRLTPREDSFYDYFSRAAENIVLAADLMRRMLTTSDDRQALAEQLRAVEHAADEVTHALMRHLNATFVTPFDREDIYRLGGRLDDVVDFLEAAADLIVLYQIEDLPREMASIADLLVRCAESTAAAMRRLRTMKQLEEYWIEINDLENQADGIYRRLVAKLFNGDRQALDVLKVKEVLDQLEAAADAFEHVADTVETIAVKDS